MKMRLRKEIGPDQVMPSWYGVAWARWDADRVICYPVPLNLVAGAVRAFVIWLRHGWTSVKPNPRDAYAQGFANGRKPFDDLTHLPNRAPLNKVDAAYEAGVAIERERCAAL